jgi:hypothetical protein
MKKLLAIVLCVMMFASFTVNAFAQYDTSDQRKWESASQTNKIVEALKTNVNNMYGAIAADTAVYQGIKSIDDMLDGLVKEMMKGYTPGSTSSIFYRNSAGTSTGSPTGQASDTIKDAVMAGLRSTIGGTITDYMTKHTNDYYKTDSNGNRVFDAAAYAGVFAKAATEAVASEKAVAGIQSYMYYILQRSTYEKVADQLSSLSSDINAWEHWDDYGWQSFGHYPVVGRAGITGTNGDNLMQNVNAIYQEFLTVENAAGNPGGMVGVDLDLDYNRFTNNNWEVGENGAVTDILLGNVNTIVGNANENVETPLVIAGAAVN